MDKTDYEEPRCPMDNSMWVEKKVSIPLNRIVRKTDEYYHKKDYPGAERLLLYWLKEAEQCGDEQGRLFLCNELMGHYRKQGNGPQALSYAARAIGLAESLGFAGRIAGATAYLNAGTVYKAFGMPEKAVACFEKCRAVYDADSAADGGRLAGLYNNMALALADLKRFAEARALYAKAIALVTDKNPADAAVSWLNLADCETAEYGPEAGEAAVCAAVDRAEKLLDAVSEQDRDGSYAFVCEKCAPVFDYYGCFAAAGKLRERAGAIYKKMQQEAE